MNTEIGIIRIPVLWGYPYNREIPAIGIYMYVDGYARSLATSLPREGR